MAKRRKKAKSRTRGVERAGGADAYPFLVVVVLVFLTRLPYTSWGFGSDPDGWRVVESARRLAETGVYSASRLPGHPLVELAASAIWLRSPTAVNVATALLSALGAAFFCLILRRLACRHYYVASLALAFVPVIYINSTNAMDYLWALAFVLASIYYISTGRNFVAGILLGLAAGCRLSSLLLVVPLALVAPRRIVFAAAALAVTALAFLPVVWTHGPSFLTFYTTRHPAPLEFLARSTIEVFGTVGVVALVVACLYTATRSPSNSVDGTLSTELVAPWRTCWVVAVGLIFALFVALPYEAGYLIPAVPFVLLLLASWMERRCFLALCVAFLVAPFIGLGPRGLSSGPLPADIVRRATQMAFAHHVLTKMERMPRDLYVVSGALLPVISLTAPRDHPAQDRFVYLLTADALAVHRKAGHQLFFLPGAELLNRLRTGVDLEAAGVEPLFTKIEASLSRE